jgi:hypothetical protein
MVDTFTIAFQHFILISSNAQKQVTLLQALDEISIKCWKAIVKVSTMEFNKI